MEEEQSIFDALSPKQTFIFGLVGGFLVVCTIGFFILLNMFMGGGFPEGKTTAPTAAPTAAAPTAPTAPTAPSQAGGNVDALVAVDSDVDHIRGNEDAAVTIVEFSDIECPFCARFHDTMKQIVDAYGDDVRWVYRHFPLTSIHPNAVTAANASECAAEQGKFWEFTDLAFANQASGLSTTALRGFAQQAGLNLSNYDDCLSERRYQDKVNADARNAQETGGRGTPHSIVIGPNGETQVISGAQPYAVVEQMVQQYL